MRKHWEAKNILRAIQSHFFSGSMCFILSVSGYRNATLALDNRTANIFVSGAAPFDRKSWLFTRMRFEHTKDDKGELGMAKGEKGSNAVGNVH